MDLTLTISTVEQLVAVASAPVALWGVGVAIVRGYRATVGRRRVVARQVERLTGGVRYAYVEDLLGPSKFRADHDGIVEDTFALGPAYVQTLTDGTGTVLLVAITTAHRRFKPEFWIGGPGSHPSVKIRLGKTRLADVPLDPEGTVTLLGTRRSGHLEAFYIGNPGNYQTFLLGHNDAGVGSIGNLADLVGPAGAIGSGTLAQRALAPDAGLSAGDPDRLHAFREATAINTMAVTLPLFDLSQLDDLPIGVDLDTVRVLPPGRLRVRLWSVLRRLRRS